MTIDPPGAADSLTTRAVEPTLGSMPGSSAIAVTAGITLAFALLSGCVQTRLRRVPADALIVDVRTRTEFGVAHLACAESLPWYDTDEPDEVNEQLPDKNRPIVVYCLSGHRSATAKKRLEAQGFTKIYDGASMLSLQHVIERTDRASGCSKLESTAR